MNVDEELDAQDLAEEQEVAPFKYSITSYGADYPIDGLVKRIRDGSIYIPSFQRGYVWSPPQASRFVESLLLGLPVPGIFLSKDDASQKLLVIDGQQRLLTLAWFYEGVFRPTGRVFALQGVQPRFEGVAYQRLSDEDRRRLDDSILHATVIKQDEPSEDESSVYYIFERLNTGGTPLRPQEIRTAIYHGPFNDLLRTLNQRPGWRALYGPEDVRMRDRELILRFLALFFRGDSYHRPLKAFLNQFMGENRFLRRYSEDDITAAFGPTVDLLNEAIGARAFRPRRTINAAVFDAVMVGVARRLAEHPIEDPVQLAGAYGALVANAEFIELTESTTTGEESVRRRLEMASQYFSDIR